MDLHIAVCDDELDGLMAVGAFLEDYRREKYNDLAVTSFHSGTELAEACAAGAHFDAVFLDILMPGLNGMETARELRKTDRRVRLIFLTSTPDFACESYGVRATNYLLKPCTRQSIFCQMDELLEETAREKSETVTVKTKTGLRTLRCDRLEYCEAEGHTLLWHMADGTVYESAGSIRETEAVLLKFPGWCKPHRSYLVNLDYVSGIEAQELLTESGARIPVPKRSGAELQELYLDWCARKGR